MDLQPLVDDVREQLLRTAGEDGSDARVVAERMTAGIDSAVRLSLLEAISAAAAEITLDLAPGSVEVRLHGRDPEFAVTVPMDQLAPPGQVTDPVARSAARDSDDGGAARITLRLSDTLKTRIEEAAGREALSVNAWLARILTAATDGGARPTPATPSTGQSFTGWVR